MPTQTSLPALSIAYRTTPDHQILDFVPGIGIVGFHYVHHGTLSETDLGLIGFRKAGADELSP
ncbi:MAG: hypothetical protein ACOYM3_10700 [Terrimicrobiaceae bacterium]